ncbi:unnamed protein product [Notodromas monacha]|uniref:RCC1-like domain-containing protein n=1 Tax=Notodromas monacha TaxID=399045 RepID=A0A7R9BRK2_9CRUS|nr:unnamed protein product [Notodromas monacha]CAG0919502.1 unnamed protein product [Notodromas monacha]
MFLSYVKIISGVVAFECFGSVMPEEQVSDFLDDASSIPESGAVLTFGRSLFGNDQEPGKFWIRNDAIIGISCGDQFTVVVAVKDALCYIFVNSIVVLAASGRVFTFGSNNHGELGLGHRKTVNKPSCIKSLKPRKIVLSAGGRAHTILATESGLLFSSGLNSDGQLGIGTDEDSFEPVPFQLLEDILVPLKQLAAGAHHSVALTVDGRVFGWGSNVEGQLGIQEQCINKPHLIAENVEKIACGYYHTALIKSDGIVYVLGITENAQLNESNSSGGDGKRHVMLPDEERAVDVSCGGSHTIILTATGRVFGFGDNERGQLGLDKVVSSCPDPAEILGLTDQKVVQISCGERHSAAITINGQLFTWGDRGYGKLCEENVSLTSGSTADGPDFFVGPVRLAWLEPLSIVKVSCGGMHTILLAKTRVQSNAVVADESSEVKEEVADAASALPSHITSVESPPTNLDVSESKSSITINDVLSSSVDIAAETNSDVKMLDENLDGKVTNGKQKSVKKKSNVCLLL